MWTLSHAVLGPLVSLRHPAPLLATRQRTSPPLLSGAPESTMYPPPQESDYVDRFCRGANALMARTNFVPSLRAFATIRTDVERQQPPLERLAAPPCAPGLSRPVWLVVVASVP